MQLPPPEIMLVKIFRSLLILDIIIVIITASMMISYDFSKPEELPDNSIATKYDYSGIDDDAGFSGEEQPEAGDLAKSSGAIILFIVIISAMIVSWVGLFNFWSWSRWLYLGVTIGSFVIAVPIDVSDFSMAWGLVNDFTEISALISGAICAMILFTPIAARFNSQRIGQTPVTEN